MDDEKDTNVSNEENENNDASNNATEETTNNEAQTNNDSSNNSFAESEARFSRLESTLERVLGELSAIREAQGILVENGAVITDTDADLDFTDTDSFVPPAELDLLI